MREVCWTVCLIYIFSSPVLDQEVPYDVGG